MSSGRKTITIHYRKFVRPDRSRFTLEQMVRSAMDYPIDGGIQLKHRYLERLRVDGVDNYFALELYRRFCWTVRAVTVEDLSQASHGAGLP